jgi:hypothetical protein
MTKGRKLTLEIWAIAVLALALLAVPAQMG